MQKIVTRIAFLDNLNPLNWPSATLGSTINIIIFVVVIILVTIGILYCRKNKSAIPISEQKSRETIVLQQPLVQPTTPPPPQNQRKGRKWRERQRNNQNTCDV